MDPNTLNIIKGAAGAAGGEGLYVEEVFSTDVYDSNNTTGPVINNGIDLATEGGLVWAKNRNQVGNSYSLSDSGRGKNTTYYYLGSDLQDGQGGGGAGGISSFNSNGYTLTATASRGNQSGGENVSWTFRKAPGFFDVVAWSGNGDDTRTISHSLGCKPGMIVYKATNNITDWWVWHKNLGANKYLRLNSDVAEGTDNNASVEAYKFGQYTPTDSDFKVGEWDGNTNTVNYVAYLFADGDESGAQIFGKGGNESIIKCGSYIGNGGNGIIKDIDLGWEPQFVLLKNASAGNTSWRIFNNMGGWISGTGYDSRSLKANTNDIEGTSHKCYITPTGFRFVDEGAVEVNAQASDNDTYIYMAIRRGQMKTPEDATKVFKTITYAGSNSAQTISGVGFAPDWMWSKDYDNGYDGWLFDRIRGIRQFGTDADREEQAEPSYVDYLNSDGVYLPAGGSTVNRNGSNHAAQFLKRAPGFFDIVTYDGDGQTNRQITHNLNAKPELMIVKQRETNRSWAVYVSAKDESDIEVMGTGKFLKLDTNDYVVTQSGVFDTAPTPSIFTVEDNTYVNINGGYYIAYLFASLSGISKVGTYDGIGNTAKDITCDGFTSGARFILIKRIDAAGNWGVWDSVRGISSTGDDPYLRFDVVNSQMNFNDISPLNTGFTVNSNNDTGGTGASGNWNINGATYIYLAIA